MSWVKLYVHVVFTTKNRIPFLNTLELRKTVFQHIKKNAIEKGIVIDSIGGFDDHAHCLISLGKEQCLSKVVQQIKGESSFWINKNNLITDKFEWQDDYWAVGVSESHIVSVRKYIFNQETHHKNNLFKKEMDNFMKKYGWEFNDFSVD